MPNSRWPTIWAEVARASPAGRAGGLPQWLLRAGLRDPAGGDSLADSADARAIVSAARGSERLERRAPEVAELIRQAFLRGISTRQVGRVVAVLTGEAVSAQTVSRLTRVLDRAVHTFHHAAAGGRLGVSGSGRRVDEGAAGVWTAAGAVVGGLRNSRAMAGGNCWPSRAPRAKARRAGRGC